MHKLFEKRIAPILQEYLHTTASSVAIPTSGLDNTVFLIATLKGNYVLRFAFEDLHTLQAHAYALRMWKRMKIPVSKIIAVGRDYVLETQVPGRDLRHTKMKSSQKKKIIKELAVILKKIHSIKTKRYGYLMNGRSGDVRSWELFMEIYLSKRLKQIRQVHGISDDLFSKVQVYFEANAHFLDYHDPRMVHKDVSPGNIIIDGGRLSGIIDASDVLSGDPMLDVGIVCEMYGENMFSSFEKIYGAVDKEKLRYYVILSAIRGITAAKLQHNDVEYQYHMKQLKKYL